MFIEEPVDGDAGLALSTPAPGVTVVRPTVPSGMSQAERESYVRQLLSVEWNRRGIERPVLWFYTPMAMPLADALEPTAVVYDCMDELSAFAGADPMLPVREAELLAKADLVFTGGRRLYEAKRGRHSAVHCFPSSVDARHYMRAREWRAEEPD